MRNNKIKDNSIDNLINIVNKMKKLGKLKLNLSNNEIKIGIYVTKMLELKLEII